MIQRTLEHFLFLSYKENPLVSQNSLNADGGLPQNQNSIEKKTYIGRKKNCTPRMKPNLVFYIERQGLMLSATSIGFILNGRKFSQH